MNSNYSSELRLADGTIVRTVSELPVLDWSITPDSFLEAFKPDFRSMFNTTLQASDTLTSADIDALFDLMPDHHLQPEVCVYVPRHRYWMLKYAQQGKWYPSPKKRKSQARMSKKWRDRA